MRRDAYFVKTSKKSFSSFIRQYGHIRPGNYDINSRNLRNSIDEIVVPMIDNSTKETIDERLESVILKIDLYLKKIDFKMDGERWVSNFRKVLLLEKIPNFTTQKV